MKLKELLSNVVENRKNGQLNTSIRKNMLRKVGISKEELFDMNVNHKLKEILLE